MKKKTLLGIAFVLLTFFSASAQKVQTTNHPDRVNWFEDLGFGMFIHWNVDVTLGAVISHTLAGSTPTYTEKYFNGRGPFCAIQYAIPFYY